MSKLKGLILDMDGTLADTEEIHRLAFNRSFREHGLDWEWGADQYADLLSTSGGRERIQAYARTQKSNHPLSEEQLREFAARVHQRKSVCYQQQFDAEPIHLRSGVRRLLEEARNCGLRLAVATNSSRANFELLMQRCDWPEIIGIWDAVISRDEIREMKPSPAVYLKALESLELPASVCVAIEDTSNGNAAARAAGLAVVITTHCFTSGHRFPGAALVADSLGDPGCPCTVTHGDPRGRTQVDVAWLQELLD